MAIFTLDQLRNTAPEEFRSLPDEDLVRKYSQSTGMPFEQAANFFGVQPRGTLSEMGRQALGGAVVDLPKMVGQGLQYTGVAPEYGREMAQAAEARAPAYEPDMRGRGLLGQAGVLGARGLAPVAATVPLAFIPGVGEAAMGIGAATLFGTSSAQETYEKLKAQGISEQDAIDAARRVGMIQGPLEGIATMTGARAAKGLSPLLGLGGKTTSGVAAGLTETSVAKPFLKNMGINAIVQPATEVGQDVGTSLVERAYGAKEEDLGEIAKQSALGGFGLTMLLGPLALGGSVSRANGAAALKSALYGENTPPAVRAQAMDVVMAEARRQGVKDENIEQWFNDELLKEDLRTEALKRIEDEQKNGGIDLATNMVPLQQRIDEQLGLTRKTVDQGYGSKALADFDPYEEIARRAAAGRPMSADEASTYLSSVMAAQKAGQEYQDLLVTQDERLARAQGLGKQFQEVMAKKAEQQLQVQDVGDQARQITGRLEAEAAQKEAPIIALLNAAAGTQQLPGLVKGAGTKADFERIMNPDVMQPVTPAGIQPPVQRTQLIPQQAAPFSNIRMDRPTQEVGQAAVPLTERPAPLSPLGATDAVLPAAPVAAGASLQGKKRGPKTPQAKQAETQGQELTAAESEHLSKLISASESEDIGDVLPASVQSAKNAVPGRMSIDQTGLKRIRDALVQGKEVADEKTQQIVDALRNFANSYKAYSDQSNQALSRRNKIAKGKTAQQFADEQASAVEMHAANVQNALAELGTAVGGNAKDIEAVVRLVKDMVQGKLAAPGSTRKAVRAELKKLDTMLSQAWAAAKREAFMGKTPDTADIRTGAIRGSIEVKGKGKMPTLVKIAKEGIYAGADLGTLKGLPGILHYMRTNGTPMERALSLALRESLTLSESKIKLEFTKDGKPRFDPSTNTVYLSEEESPEVILHEAFHAALQSFVYKNPNHPAVVQLKKSLKSVVNYKGELTGKALEVQTLLKGLMAQGNELDAVLELVSYGNTLAEFRKALQTMKSDKNIPASFLESVSKAWAAIKQIATRLLGGKPSLASDVLQSSLELLEKAQKQTAVTGQGQVLEAAITTNKPVSNARIAETLGVREPDYTRWEEKNLVNVFSTQRIFEAIGWSKEGWVGKSADKLAAWARDTAKKYPGAEIVAGLINSRYNVNRDVSNIQDDFKFDKNVGYQVAERIANYITGKSAPEVLAIFDYLDGNKKALDNVDDGGKLKGLADNMKKWFDLYVKELSPVEQRFFTTRKFSENLLFPARTEEVARNQFGLGKINAVLGKKSQYESEIDHDWMTKDANGDPIVSGDFYRVFKTTNTIKGTPESAGFMSVARFDELGRKDPMGYAVDTTRKWILESGEADKGKFKFTTNTTAKEKIADEKADDLANALRNTMAALANNYASKNFISALAKMGNEESPHARVAYDSIEAINKDFGTNFQEDDDRILRVSEEMSRSEKTRDLYRMTGTWVKMPTSDVFGELSGQYLPGPVWNSMIDMYSRQPVINSPLLNNTMRWFKKSKTTLNFGTHFTNAASNITMAMMHDISFKTMRDATKLLYRYEFAPKSLTTQERLMVEQFINSGAMLGDFSSAEVKEALYKAHEQNLTNGNDDTLLARVAGTLNIEKSKAEFLQKNVAKADDFMSQMYAFEDNAFRMAAFMKSVGQEQLKAGVKTPTEEMYRTAGKFALGAFGDYDIDSKAVKALRQTVMPFVSWGYAMGPLIGRMVLTQPWKVANVLMAYYLIEAAMSGAAGGDDEELRKSGPESIRERMFFGSVGPYMHVRVPFMGDDKNPVYYKLGDYFPAASMTKGLPNGFAGQSWIPSMVTPSGPFVSAVASLILGVDTYTGKSIHQPTDSEWQKLWNSTKAAYDIVSPPGISSRQIGRANDFFEGKTGITGAEPSPMVFARAFGLKLYDYNVIESEAIQNLAVKRIEKDFKAAMTKAKRDEYRKGYPDYETLDKTLDDLRTRMEEEKAKKRGED